MPDTTGKILRDTRESKDLSLEQIANITHIRVRYLEALENDQVELLPSPIQGRGFLRLYADFLGLDPSALLLALNEESAARDGEEINTVKNEVLDDLETTTSASGATSSDVEEEEFDDGDTFDDELDSIKRFNTIGNALRQRRELLGLSFEDVEQVTHLRIHYLRLMESGKVNDLPSLVQARGMLQNYARFLEIDVETILLQFAEGLETRRLELAPPQAKTKTRSQEMKRPSLARRLVTPDLLIGIGLFGVLMLFIIWSAAQASAVRRGLATSTLLPISELLAVTTPAELLQNTETPTVAFTRPPGEDDILPTSPGVGDIDATDVIVNTSLLQLQVVAKQRTWLRVRSDGEEVFNARIAPGNAYQFSGNDLVEVITGNAAAIQVFFNSRDVGPLGVTGQVLSLQFTQTGILTPTTQFTPESTLTPPATVTLAPTPTNPTPTVTPFIP